jgi:hypothetical protein
VDQFLAICVLDVLRAFAVFISHEFISSNYAMLLVKYDSVSRKRIYDRLNPGNGIRFGEFTFRDVLFSMFCVVALVNIGYAFFWFPVLFSWHLITQIFLVLWAYDIQNMRSRMQNSSSRSFWYKSSRLKVSSGTRYEYFREHE